MSSYRSLVQKSAKDSVGEATLIARPIGDDPVALRTLNPNLDIWEAYATIHVVMPDGSMKVGGEAVAEVFRRLPKTRWFTRSFALGIFGFRPFQAILNLGYLILADVRPLFGCESCGTPSRWIRPIRWLVKWIKTGSTGKDQPKTSPHFSPVLPAKKAAG
jgi:hypothetical protein